MTTTTLGKFGRYALWISPVLIVVVGYFSVIHWMKPQKTFVLVLGAVAAIFVMGYASFTALRVQRQLDEVQIASQRFASSHGWVWGMMATVLLLMLPPVTNRLIHLANMLSTGSPDGFDRGSVHLALFLGFMLVVLMQTVCVIVASVIWERRMGGTQDQS